MYNGHLTGRVFLKIQCYLSFQCNDALDLSLYRYNLKLRGKRETLRSLTQRHLTIRGKMSSELIMLICIGKKNPLREKNNLIGLIN